LNRIIIIIIIIIIKNIAEPCELPGSHCGNSDLMPDHSLLDLWQTCDSGTGVFVFSVSSAFLLSVSFNDYPILIHLPHAPLLEMNDPVKQTSQRN